MAWLMFAVGRWNRRFRVSPRHLVCYQMAACLVRGAAQTVRRQFSSTHPERLSENGCKGVREERRKPDEKVFLTHRLVGRLWSPPFAL
jgi:hypothetical protein